MDYGENLAPGSFDVFYRFHEEESDDFEKLYREIKPLVLKRKS